MSRIAWFILAIVSLVSLEVSSNDLVEISPFTSNFESFSKSFSKSSDNFDESSDSDSDDFINSNDFGFSAFTRLEQGADGIHLGPHEMISNFYGGLSKITLLVQGANETSVYLMPGVFKHYDAKLSLIHCVKALICIVDDLTVDTGDYTLFIVNEETDQFVDVNIKTTIQSGDMMGLFILGLIALCVCGFGFCIAKKRMDVDYCVSNNGSNKYNDEYSKTNDEYRQTYTEFMATCPEDVKYPLSNSISNSVSNSGYPNAFGYDPMYPTYKV